ncbi:hypothetical protein CIT14_22120, partial [Virgibacillus profundi]
CVHCERPAAGGRVRPMAVAGYDRPVVCDLCWSAVGGPAAVAALVDDASGIPRGQLAPDAAIVELYASATPVDELHPIDRLLVESGIALERVRQIAPAGRVSLAGEILARRPPEHTRAARSPQEWLEVAEHR